MHIYTTRKPMDGSKEIINGKLLMIRKVKSGENVGGVDIIDVCSREILRRTTRVMEREMTSDGITFKTYSGAEYDFIDVSTLIPTYVKPEPSTTEENSVQEAPKETENPAEDKYVSPVTFRDLFDYIQTANRYDNGIHRRGWNDELCMHIYDNLHQVNIVTSDHALFADMSLINFVYTENDNDLEVNVYLVDDKGVADYDHPHTYDGNDRLEDCALFSNFLKLQQVKIYLIDVLEKYIYEREEWKELNVEVLNENHSIRPAHYCDALKRVDYKLSRELTREEFIKFCELKHLITNEESLHPYGPYAKFEGSGNQWSHITVEPYTD